MLITRRRLPHHYEIGVPLFVTFHLAGALPPGRYPRPGVENARAAFVWMDRMLDHATRGPRWLVEEGVAEAVARVLEETRDEYELRAWVLMPNHAHLLAVPRIDPAKMMQRIKGASARAAQLVLGRTGERFWQGESYDHLVREEAGMPRVVRYIENNPVQAGLCAAPEQWRWSSAWPSSSA